MPRCMFVFVRMGWRRVATVAKHCCSFRPYVIGPMPRGVFHLWFTREGSSWWNPQSLPVITLTAGSWSFLLHFSGHRVISLGGCVSHGISQIKCCFGLYTPPLEKTQHRPVWQDASLWLKSFFSVGELCWDCTPILFAKAAFTAKKFEPIYINMNVL